MAQKRFNDLVVLVRNGVAVPALVVSSQLQADGREFLSVLYADPTSGPTLVLSGATRKVGTVQLGVPPLNAGAGYGWFDLPVNDAHAALLADHADALEWNNRLGDHPGSVAPGSGGYPEGHEQAYGGAPVPAGRAGFAPYNNRPAVSAIDPALVGTPGIHVPLDQRQVLESDIDRDSRLRNLAHQHPPATLISTAVVDKLVNEKPGSGSLRYPDGADHWTETGDGTDYPGSYNVGPQLKAGDQVRVIESDGKINPNLLQIVKIEPESEAGGPVFFVEGGDSAGYVRDRLVRIGKNYPTAYPGSPVSGGLPVFPENPANMASVEAAQRAGMRGEPATEGPTSVAPRIHEPVSSSMPRSTVVPIQPTNQQIADDSKAAQLAGKVNTATGQINK
jgi:hypothetical protein